MTNNSKILLEQILADKKITTSPESSDSEFFELFVSEQVLKNFDLSNDEVEAGLTGNGGDGGIDSIYTFINGELLHEDTDLSGYKKDILIELFIVQAKRSPKFAEVTLERFAAVTNDVFDFSKDLSSLISVYNADLLKIVGYFRKAFLHLTPKFPKLKVSYVYASLGDTQQIHPNTARKETRLRLTVTHHLPDSEFDFLFLGARELTVLARKGPAKSLQLNLHDSVISTSTTGDQGYLCLVKIKEYYKFIVDENRILRRNIFDANVRDYHGEVEVNKGIKDTLRSIPSEDFWWLNNGITITATKGSIVGRTITLEDSQIVNGLQTSTEIFNYFKDKPELEKDEERAILVKIVVTQSATSRDKIIKATNSQTAMPAASLKATDAIQRDIEDFFLTKGLYYDRRKNFYKNQGYAKEKIIGIPYLAQAVMAIVHRSPNDSRSQPTRLLRKSEDYDKIFNLSYPLDVYLICTNLMKVVDSFIKSSNTDISQEEKNNLRFHTAMYVAVSIIGNSNYGVQEVSNLNLDSISEDFLYSCLSQVVSVFRQLRKKTGDQADVVGKSKELVSELLKHYRLKNIKSKTKSLVGN